MAQDLEKLIVSLEANLKQYERELARAQKTTVTQLRKIEGDAAKSMGRVEKSFARAGSALAGFGKGLVIGGIFAAVAGVEQLVAGSISSAAAIGDLSDKLGITTDKLQEIQHGAVQANLSFEDMESGLLKFSKALGQARNGQGDLLKLLRANGFTDAQIKALDLGEALDIMADLTKNAASEQDALLIILQSFGKGGDGFLELLRNGSEGLKKFANEARTSDTIIKEGLIRSAQVFDDAWSAALLRVKAGLGNFVLSILPLSNKIDKAVADSVKRLAVAVGSVNPALIDSTSSVSGPKSRGFVSTKGDRQPVTVVPNPEDEAARLKAIEDRKRAYEAEQKAITGVITALQFELTQGKASELQQQINTELRKAGTAATDEQKQQIIALTTAKFNQAQAEEALIDLSEKQLELDQELFDSKMALAEIAVDAFDAIVVGGEKAEDVLKNLVKQLASAAIKAMLLGQGPLASLFGTSSGGGIFGSLFGGGKAGGGHVNAGTPYMVGEKGREMFVPSQSGTIIPNGKGGGGQTVIANFYGSNNDATGMAMLRADFQKFQQNFAKNVRNTVSGEKSLNPRFAR